LVRKAPWIKAPQRAGLEMRRGTSAMSSRIGSSAARAR
jgi:hypothetical protein